MSPSDYTEELLVEQPAIQLFAELGLGRRSRQWKNLSGRLARLGRETKSEVVLVPKLRAALERLNPALPADAINSAVDELARDRSAMSLAAANREVWDLLRDGVTVSVAGSGARRAEDRAGAGRRLGESAGERLSAREPDDDHGRALYLPA